MPDEDVLADIGARGGDVAALTRMAHADDKALQPKLKELGYSKLGERARLVAALKAAPLDVSDATAPAPAAASAAEEDVVEGDSTMVMHGAVFDIFDDGGLLKTTLRLGDLSGSTPPPLSRCKVRYIGSVLPACTRFEAVVREFQMGEEQVPRGLEKCVSTMRKGETCELICRAEYAYGEAGKPPDVPPGASVRFELELISWIPPKKERFELSLDERMDEAARLKKQGTGHFSSGQWLEAQVAYHEASRLLVDELDYLKAPAGRELEARALLVACILNVAVCALKREEWFAAERACTNAIEKMADPLGLEREANGKALFRRAKARIGSSNFDGARADVKAALALQPNSRELRELWASIREREEVAEKSESEVYARMTTKLVYKEYNVGRKKLSSYPRVFFELAINGNRLPNRVVMELFVDRCPKTCENFRALCTGERGVSPTGTRLHYKGTCFHRAFSCDDLPPEFMNESADGTGRNFEVWKGFLAQGGDIVNGDGTGGESIYGEPFEDENFELKFSHPGMLAMAGSMPMRTQAEEEMVHKPHRNTSQFFITTKERNHAQGGCTILHFNMRHVIFGRVVEGIQSVQQINRMRNDPTMFHQLLDKVEIVECGQLKSMEEEYEEREAAKYAKSAPKPRVDEPPAAEAAPPPPPPPRPPPEPKPRPVPTAEDLAIVSAEVDDD